MKILLNHRGLMVLGACLAMGAAAIAQPVVKESGWTGNVINNPGFEEDFVNARGESHVLSFKGDWYYNQKDLVPDYWKFDGVCTWETQGARDGGHYLKVPVGAYAEQIRYGAVSHDGGGAWGGVETRDIVGNDPKKTKRPWRVTAWVRNGGTIVAAGVTHEVPASPQWQQVTVDIPADKVPDTLEFSLRLKGPGEFDDVVAQERIGDEPNLIPNAGFEDADAEGRPVGWSEQRKYRTIGPTYYVWTDWNHAFRANVGGVRVDPLISLAGKQSLRFDVYPGDEKYIESDVINVNQAQPGLIEVGVYVRADRARLIDIRAVDLDGANLPTVHAIFPEYSEGGSATYGNGTFEWRYIRKFFAAPFDKPMKGFRLRLCARGFNGHTLDDAGTRSYACQVSTIWWDNLTVTERGTTPAELAARGVKTQPATSLDAASDITDARINLGDRLFGDNTLRLTFSSSKESTYQVRLTTALPGGQSVVTESAKTKSKKGEPVTIDVGYRIDKLVGDLKEQGTLRVELIREGGILAKPSVVTDTTYAFNTWPVIVDFDVSRSYSLPAENPVTTSLNLGVASVTLAKVARLELFLAAASDPSKPIQPVAVYTDLKKACEETLVGIKAGTFPDKEFNLPTPATSVDRAHLIMLKVDLSKLKVWPHDHPMRDTVLVARATDGSGKVLFEDKSEPFGRMNITPRQEAIKEVEIREDGAVLINGKPRFLFGATHQNQRTGHDPKMIAQLGLMGHRLTQGFKNEDMDTMFKDLGLYSLQAKPDPEYSGTVPVVELNDQTRKNLTDWVNRGGMQSIVSINTGGWEGTIDFNNPQEVAKHKATNEFITKLTKRPLAISTSGAYNAWWIDKTAIYDINHAETEMWGPMDFNVIYTPYINRARKTPGTWVYLPQLYDNTPHERYRFETYENIIRGSAGVSMIQGIGDPTFNRGLAGELRYLEAPLNSLKPLPDFSVEPLVSHRARTYEGKGYILATNAGPIQMGNWTWNTQVKHSGNASHEGDTVNTQWFRPDGIRIHGFRGMPMPELIQKGDKIIQYVWLDPKETPDWVMVCVRGDGRFAHNATLGSFDFAKFRSQLGNIIMYSELNHSVWHEINWVFDAPAYEHSVKLMGKAWADNMKTSYEEYRAKVDHVAYQPGHFHKAGDKPTAGEWVRIEIDAEKYGLVGKLVDGFAYLTQNGRALWDYSALERDGKVVHVFNEDSVGIDRDLLKAVRFNVPGLKKGTKVTALFEGREITAEDGYFTDNMEGVDSYGYEGSAVEGDMFGFVKDPNRELARMLPSGYGYKYGPTAVRIYEFKR